MKLKKDGSKPKILIVEDEAILSETLKELLEEIGYLVTGCADSSEQAQALFYANEPDLILMDIHLKGEIDGVQVAEKIQKERAVPVVFLTANQEDATFERAKIIGAYGYILKPFNERELKIVIEIALSQFEDRKTIYEMQGALLKIEKLGALGNLTMGLINDINSPLTLLYHGIRKIDNIIEEHSNLGINEFLTSAIHFLKKGVESISNTTMNYKSILESYESEIPIHIKVEKYVNISLDLCRFVALEKKIRFRQISGSENSVIWFSPTSFVQILVNLISNSFKSVGHLEGSWIEIKWEEDKENNLLIKVTDSGTGLSPKDQAEIFDSTFLFNSDKSGIGLGLMFCRKTAEKFNASIYIDQDSPNTCFVLKINLNKNP